ncbi:MAG: hypothetical protein K0R66_623 [Gammaproteobacteria bacterium]|jgi:hypothetical protein|nr:hypothetical protein [Gammaproteobacteria bacterium]
MFRSSLTFFYCRGNRADEGAHQEPPPAAAPEILPPPAGGAGNLVPGVRILGTDLVESHPEVFGFANITDLKLVRGDAYLSVCDERFHYLTRRDLASHSGASEKGWKAHISVPSPESFTHNDNVELAWNAILPIVIKYGLGLCKVIQDEYIGLKSTQPGKDITLYQFTSPGLDWQNMLVEIEAKLRSVFAEAKGPTPRIRNGFEISNNKELSMPGSLYMYCACDSYETLAEAEAQAARGDRGPFNDINLRPSVRRACAEDSSPAPGVL